MDIAATVNPATVHFRSLTEPEKVSVVEQNYEYDLLEPAKLLNKYVGKEVTLVRTYMDNGTTKHEEVKATLLANNNGPVWKIGNEIVTGMYRRNLSISGSAGQSVRPANAADDTREFGTAKQKIEASYLATNLSWNADYVLTVGREDKTRRSRWLGDGGEQFRDGVSQCQVAAGGRRSEPDTSGSMGRAAMNDAVAMKAAAAPAPNSSRKISANIICIRLAEKLR